MTFSPLPVVVFWNYLFVKDTFSYGLSPSASTRYTYLKMSNKNNSIIQK